MNRTLTIALNEKLKCCIGDNVVLNVRAVEKLTSYGSAVETSGVPATIVGAGLNSDGTYSYVVTYDVCVLKETCNYLLPIDICSVCCLHDCGCHHEPICNPAPCNYIRSCCGN